MHDEIQQQLNSRYLAAKVAWTMTPGVQEMARVIGMPRRAYCDAYARLNFPPLTWTSASGDGWQPDVEAAYRSSGEGGV